MELTVAILLLILGLVMIVKGGDFFVDAASWMAEVSGIPPLLVGATVVSVATTLPELIVSVMATAQGSVEIAVGNAVGSVVANIGLIMAISLICLPSKVNRKDYMFKSVLLVVAIVVLWLCCMGGKLNVWISLIVFAMFGLFVAENVRGALKATKAQLDASSTGANVEIKQPVCDTASDVGVLEGGATADEKTAEDADGADGAVKKDKRTVIKNIILFLLGAVGIVGGADLLVRYGQKLAEMAHVPEGIIAVTLVAIGTSLPELVTTITAIVKRKASLSVGNIIGANILDMTMILPICAMVSGGSLIVPKQALWLDIPFCLGLSVIAVVPMLIRKRFYRWQGFALIACYAAYLALRIIYT